MKLSHTSSDSFHYKDVSLNNAHMGYEAVINSRVGGPAGHSGVKRLKTRKLAHWTAARPLQVGDNPTATHMLPHMQSMCLEKGWRDITMQMLHTKSQQSGLMRMKMMWIICFGLCIHQMSTQFNSYGRFWTDMFHHQTPNDGIDFGRMVLPSLQQSSESQRTLRQKVLKPFCLH